MKTRLALLLTALLLSLTPATAATVRYVDVNSTNASPPFLDWSTAATNIQDAIDVAVDGDQIFVTNGVYQTGGRVMAGDLTNRVALNKAVTVQSMNGPWVTTIRGAGAVYGLAAVRCAWLTNGAALIGFTLLGGGTRDSGDMATLLSGGGVWCASSNALVANCRVVTNTAYRQGGGVFQGTINNSILSSNVINLGNGSAAYGANLNNCTVVSNTCPGNPYAVYLGRLTNCIVYYDGAYNYAPGGTFSYCCTTPAPGGSGNFTNAPQLYADGVHLLSTSPCIGTGTNRITGTDIFGRLWANPPSVGCAEWDPAPMVTQPQFRLTSDPVGFTVGNVALSAQAPYSCWWLKDGIPLLDNGHFSGTQSSNLVATGILYSDMGGYQLVVSNAWGMVTSGVAQSFVIHCVDAAGTNPIPPYLTWGTAATNIQDAITASAAGEVVLVTNGVYASGGKSMDGVITNRISVDKIITVQSVNGPGATIIQGAWDPSSTNGPAAVRCAWVTNAAVLSGFTLRGGATRAATGAPYTATDGGGVFGVSTNSSIPTSTLANCVVANNAASDRGGGAYLARLINCTITGNSVTRNGTGIGDGGGGCTCYLKNCLITQNSAAGNGGGAAGTLTVLQNCALIQNSSWFNGGAVSSGSLINCTVVGNSSSGYSSGYGAAVYGATLANCIVWGNLQRTSYPYTNYASCTLAYCCADPLATGVGNISADPQLLADGFHLSAPSSCRGAGTNTVVIGSDIDGQPWANPPSIGCDEWQPAPAISLPPVGQIGYPAHGLTFTAVAAGQSPFGYFWSKDGVLIQDDAHHTNSSTAAMVVRNFGPEDAGIYQVVVSNAFGMATSPVVQVVIHVVDAAGANPIVPYLTWATAATNIQDAIDTAVAGDIVLVTNGIYAAGGKVMAGDLSNRVALNKALTVTSVNGCWVTAIQGAWDPITTNGPGAVRCAWLTNGAVLSGFMLRDGATRPDDGFVGSRATSGGGVWCSPYGLVSNCVLSNNRAAYGGGMIYGTLNNSLVDYNVATYGSGIYGGTLNNCTVRHNSTTGNIASPGGVTYNTLLRNSVVLDNYYWYPYNLFPDRAAYDHSYSGSQAFYSCSYGYLSGPGNLQADNINPAFLDEFHIASISPCRGIGSTLYASGADLDGEPWANPPSMGCDEVVLSNLAGPLVVNILQYQLNGTTNRWAYFSGSIIGRASRVEWSFGDGPTITNYGVIVGHQWTNVGDYAVTFTAFNSDNPGGVSTNLIFSMRSLMPPQLQSAMSVSNMFLFQFVGQGGVIYGTQYTTNLVPPVRWATLGSLYVSTGQVYQITAPIATNGNRFYRVLAQ